MIVDHNDIPELIQDLRYSSMSMMFTAYFFNGVSSAHTTEEVCPSVGLHTLKPSRMQWLEAENNISKIALKTWAEYAKSAS